MPTTYIYNGFENGQTSQFEIYVDEDDRIVIYSEHPVQGMAFTREQARRLVGLIEEHLED